MRTGQGCSSTWAEMPTWLPLAPHLTQPRDVGRPWADIVSPLSHRTTDASPWCSGLGSSGPGSLCSHESLLSSQTLGKAQTMFICLGCPQGQSQALTSDRAVPALGGTIALPRCRGWVSSLGAHRKWPSFGCREEKTFLGGRGRQNHLTQRASHGVETPTGRLGDPKGNPFSRAAETVQRPPPNMWLLPNEDSVESKNQVVVCPGHRWGGSGMAKPALCPQP